MPTSTFYVWALRAETEALALAVEAESPQAAAEAAILHHWQALDADQAEAGLEVGVRSPAGELTTWAARVELRPAGVAAALAPPADGRGVVCACAGCDALRGVGP